MILRYIVYFPISIFMLLQNYITAPIVVLFAKTDENGNGYLPNIFNWWMTPDNPLEGDKGYKTEHAPFLNPKYKFQIYINRVFWLYRNSMYGFDINVLGCKLKNGFIFKYIGNPNTSNRPLSKGIVLRWVNNRPHYYFQLYIIIPYSFLFLKNKCIRINLGFKLWNTPKVYEVCQYVTAISPWASTG
jgi:hypothetical protein